MRPEGFLAVVGLGPGDAAYLCDRARAVLADVDTIIGYAPYCEQVRAALPGARVEPWPIGAEERRALDAARRARAGERVAVVSSGDAGVYGMASLVLDALYDLGWDGEADPGVEVVPGITAALAAAARLGAPFGVDVALISLSDLLVPWETVERRLRGAAAGDFAVALYNPRSRAREHALTRALRILGEHRDPSTPAALAHDVCRPGERLELCELGSLDVTSVSMTTLVVVGSSTTRRRGRHLITARRQRAVSDLDSAIARIRPLDAEAMEAARAHQASLTKPPGSLGRLEELAVRLAGIRGRDGAALGAGAVLVCAADHGVAAEGVSAYPAEVTPQMVLNFLGGGAAINVLARQAGIRVVVLDAGVAADLPAHPDLLDRKVRRATGNIVREPAMSREEAVAAVEAGIAAAWALADAGVEVLCVGDMGIGNTTAASAVVAAVTGAPGVAVAGRGTGLDDEGVARKASAIDAALARAGVDPHDGIGVLAELGGLEIGAIAGAVIGAASRCLAVVVDGHPATAGAAIAALLAPPALEYCIAGHRSAELAHHIALEHLALDPLLNLGLRLGEGTGATLALHVVRAAALLSAEMATFQSAGVSRSTAELEVAPAGPGGSEHAGARAAC